MVDVGLDALREDQPWSRMNWRLVCRQSGLAGSVNIVPNWHDCRAGTHRFRPDGRSKRPPAEASLVVPNALSALAFEHMKDDASIRTCDHSDEREFIAA